MLEKVWKVMKLVGTNSNAMDAWMLNNGMKTLELRMDRHCQNADTLAHFLQKNKIHITRGPSPKL